MENNFYVGIVHHSKRLLKIKSEYSEKVVLYSDDNVNYLDLKNGIWYTTDGNNRNYVEEESLIPTDISQYRENYLYLLSSYVERGIVRKRII